MNWKPEDIKIGTRFINSKGKLCTVQEFNKHDRDLIYSKEEDWTGPCYNIRDNKQCTYPGYWIKLVLNTKLHELFYL